LCIRLPLLDVQLPIAEWTQYYLSLINCGPWFSRPMVEATTFLLPARRIAQPQFEAQASGMDTSIEALDWFLQIQVQLHRQL
jgi:hypothetical protein